MKSIFIFRRDFRITDNTGLIECIKNSDTVYPIFIFTPEQIKNNDYKSDNAVQFMITSLKYLAKKIDMTFCYGDYVKVLKEFFMNIFISFQLGEVEVSNLTIVILAFFSSFTFIAVGISSYKLFKSLIKDDDK